MDGKKKVIAVVVSLLAIGLTGTFVIFVAVPWWRKRQASKQGAAQQQGLAESGSMQSPPSSVPSSPNAGSGKTGQPSLPPPRPGINSVPQVGPTKGKG